MVHIINVSEIVLSNIIESLLYSNAYNSNYGTNPKTYGITKQGVIYIIPYINNMIS